MNSQVWVPSLRTDPHSHHHVGLLSDTTKQPTSSEPSSWSSDSDDLVVSLWSDQNTLMTGRNHHDLII